jgi:hypothetical protein
VMISNREKTMWFLRGLLFGLTGYRTRELRELEKRRGERLTVRGWKGNNERGHC